MDVDMNSITGIPTWSNYYKYLSFNPILMVVIIVVIILYLLLFSSLGKMSDENVDNETSGGVKILGIILASIFLLLLLINGFNYFLNIDIVTSVKNFFTKNPEIDIIVDDIETEFEEIAGVSELLPNSESELNSEPEQVPEPIPEIDNINQVYHIPGNRYSYNDAKAICKAYGSRLANYKEIEKAYKDGADWCSYGWSDNQMALFPTQYDKWEHLQKSPKHKNDCGRPGINGGYIDNHNIKFGVNCYGHKPKITPLEAELMEDASIYPRTKEEAKFEKRVDYWKSRIDDILVSPFNSKNWSKI